MAKYYNRYPYNNLFSRFSALTALGWLIIIAIAVSYTFQQNLGISFRTQLTTFNSYWIIYQQRWWILAGILVFTLAVTLITAIRISTLPYHKIIRILLLLLPIIFLIALTLLCFNLYQFITALHIPINQGLFALRQYVNSFSIETIQQAFTALPHQIYSIKHPLYTVIYSYIGMLFVIIALPFHSRYSTHTLWRKTNLPIVILFIITYLVSVGYLGHYFIFHDPFTPWEALINPSMLP